MSDSFRLEIAIAAPSFASLFTDQCEILAKRFERSNLSRWQYTTPRCLSACLHTDVRCVPDGKVRCNIVWFFIVRCNIVWFFPPYIICSDQRCHFSITRKYLPASCIYRSRAELKCSQYIQQHHGTNRCNVAKLRR